MSNDVYTRKSFPIARALYKRLAKSCCRIKRSKHRPFVRHPRAAEFDLHCSGTPFQAICRPALSRAGSSEREIACYIDERFRRVLEEEEAVSHGSYSFEVSKLMLELCFRRNTAAPSSSVRGRKTQTSPTNRLPTTAQRIRQGRRFLPPPNGPSKDRRMPRSSRGCSVGRGESSCGKPKRLL
jgi:hypothetical protein